MRRLSCLWIMLFGGMISCAEGADRPKIGLLIGVGKYAHLSAGEQLDGCRNDVEAIKGALQTRFGFQESDLVTLLDEQATGSEIRNALKNLELRARQFADAGTPAAVVLHFSGHGSQVADQPEGDPDADEDDGLDETLVPYDAQRQGGPEDLRDDELFSAVERICATGATMWVILDCCHSGTGARGVTKVRKLNRSGLAAAAAAPGRQITPRRLPAGAVFLSACQPHEVEPEFEESGRSYGLLSRFLTQVLNEEPTVSGLTHDLLREAIVHRYRSTRSVVQAPQPSLEFGSAASLEKPILGGLGVDRPPIWNVQAEDGGRRVRVLAGALQGVTVGSLYQLYPSPNSIPLQNQTGQTDTSLAWMEITAVEGASATAKVFRYENDEQQPSALPARVERAYAIERQRRQADGGLRVRVVRAADASGDGPTLTPEDMSVPQPIRDALQGITRREEAAWLTWTGPDESCDLVIRVDGDFAAIFPASGRSVIPAATPQVATTRGLTSSALKGGWGPIDLRQGRDGSDQLKDALRRITRARNLLTVASNQSGGGLTPVRLRLEVLKVTETNDGAVTMSQVLTPEGGDGVSTGERVMRDGDEYTFRVTNEDASGQPVYLTLLHVDSNMGIDQIHPYQPSIGSPVEGVQKLAAGESLTVDGYFVTNGDPDEPPIYGPRWVVALATRSPNQFYLLAQDSLPVTRGARGEESPLESLMNEQMHFQTRGGFSRQKPKPQYDDSWGAAILQWTVQPALAP